MLSNHSDFHSLEDPSSYYDRQYKKRGNSLHQSQSQPKLSQRQTINMIKLLDRYSSQTYPIDHTPRQRLDYTLKPIIKNRKSVKKLNLDQYDSNYQEFNQYTTPTNSRFHQILEKELYSLKADLNRLKAIEFEQNKKYENQLQSMMKQNQRYPPPNVLFGGAQEFTPKMAMGQPLFFF